MLPGNDRKHLKQSLFFINFVNIDIYAVGKHLIVQMLHTIESKSNYQACAIIRILMQYQYQYFKIFLSISVSLSIWKILLLQYLVWYQYFKKLFAIPISTFNNLIGVYRISFQFYYYQSKLQHQFILQYLQIWFTIFN